MRIGLFLRNLNEEYQITVYRGIRSEAEKLGLELVCVQGEMLSSTLEGGEQPFPTSRAIHFDGILLLTSVLHLKSDEILLDHRPTTFGTIPTVSIGNRLADYVSIIIKNREPMERLMKHLIEDHRYRRFLFIGGPVWHRDNTVREHVFRRTINLYRRSFPEIESQVINGDFNEAKGMQILRDYIDAHPASPVDAVLAANDNMAIGALKALRLRDSPYWGHCAVTGFDDIPQAAHSIPPLTSVRQPLEDLGTMAVRILSKMMAGETVSRVIPIDSEFVIRESCGCQPKTPVWQRKATLTQALEQETLKKEILDIQRQTLQSEENLRQVSIFGQRLISVATQEELVTHLQTFLNNLSVKTFYLFLYTDGEAEVAVHEDCSLATLAYERHNGRERIAESGEGRRGIASLFTDASPREARCVYHLQTGEEKLGFIVYSVEDSNHPHICSIAVHIANTVKRLRVQQEEKERSRRLEEEVALRTMDLVEANSKLQREVQRRTEIEAELRKNRRSLESILEAMPIPVAVFTTEGGQLRYANQAFRRATDWAGDTAIPVSRYIEIDSPMSGTDLSLHRGEIEGESIPVLVHTAPLMFNGENCRIAGMVDLSRQRALETEVLKISEMERLRFSLDLHDDICQRLAGISMLCKSLATDPKLQELSVMIDETLSLTRQYAHASFPMELDTLGLGEVLEGLCQTVSRQVGSVCRYQWRLAEKHLPLVKSQEINVYRIVQEAIHNAVKHAKADLIEVTVRKVRKTILVQVRDNGGGMSGADRAGREQGSKGGMGLRSMEYRARQLGGSINFESDSRGTTVNLSIPLPRASSL